MSKIFTIATAFTLSLLVQVDTTLLAQDLNSDTLDEVDTKAKPAKKTKRKNKKPTDKAAQKNSQTELEVSDDLKETKLYQYVQLDTTYLVPYALINKKYLSPTFLYQTSKSRSNDRLRGESSFTSTISGFGVTYSQPITNKFLISAGLLQVKSESKEESNLVFTFTKLYIPLFATFKVTNNFDAGLNIIHHKDTFKVGPNQLSSSYETFGVSLGLHSNLYEASLSHQLAKKNKGVFASSNSDITSLFGRYKISGGFSLAAGYELSASEQQKDTTYKVGTGIKGKSAHALFLLNQEKTVLDSNAGESENSFSLEGAHLNSTGLPTFRAKIEYFPGRKSNPADSSTSYEYDASFGVELGANIYF